MPADQARGEETSDDIEDTDPPNLAARAARWSTDRWKTATGAWIAVAVVAALIGGIVGTVKLTDSEQGTGETARGQQILADAGFNTPAGESVLVQSPSLTAGDPGSGVR